MKRLLHKGLQATKELFAVVRPLFALLLEVAQMLSNHQQWKADEVQKRFEEYLTRMRAHAEQAETGRSALVHFLKVTQSYAPHLFFCYQIADLPKPTTISSRHLGMFVVASVEQPDAKEPFLGWSCADRFA